MYLAERWREATTYFIVILLNNRENENNYVQTLVFFIDIKKKDIRIMKYHLESKTQELSHSTNRHGGTRLRRVYGGNMKMSIHNLLME